MGVRMVRGWIFGLIPGILLSLTGAVLSGCERGSTSGQPPSNDVQGQIVDSRRTALVKAVERVAPTVVGVLSVGDRRASPNELRRELLGRIFPSLAPVQEATRVGSGIVLDSRGFFLTNDHLVANASELWVFLADGRQLPAQLVGTDPSYDLAVIKVDAEGQSFQTSPLGDSESLMVGEWVVAVGNPYGLYLKDPRPSVTAGVISALHRDIRLNEGSAIYKDMIQTDAAINPGNSGGPLVNANGDVVGINTFIFTQAGQSLGLGFAIPIHIALAAAEELILYGAVRGIWVGFAVERLTRPFALQLGVEPGSLVVWSLERGSPGERAGIQLGDVIRTINGKRVTDPQEAKRSIFGARVGDRIDFGIERDGAEISIPVTLEAFPSGSQRRGRS